MTNLFSKEERLPAPIYLIGSEQHRHLYGDDNWGSATYYADYAGIACKYRPKNILEMGVFHGYSAVAIIHGAKRGGVDCLWYIGIDAELEERNSNSFAYDNLCFLFPENDFVIYKNNLMETVKQEVYNAAPYDLINVDAVHTVEGTVKTLELAWKLCAKPRGIIILDDLRDPLVREGKDIFLGKLIGKMFSSQIYENERGWFIIRKESE